MMFGVSDKIRHKLGCTTTKIAGASREHLCTKVTPDLHLTYSRNGGNLGLDLK